MMKFTSLFLGFVLAIVLAIAGRASAAEIAAASVSQIDVAAAVTNAVDGDVIRLPAGSTEWTNTLTISKSVTLIGAGSSTVLTNSTSFNYLIAFDFITNKPVRVSTMKLVNNTGYSCVSFGNANGNSLSAYRPVIGRADHLTIVMNGNRGISCTSPSALKIDHCYFTGTNQMTGVSIFGWGSNSFNATIQLGTTNVPVIEDCVFDWPAASNGANGAVDSYNGAQWMARYNNCTNINFGNHGTDSSGVNRGTFGFEIYGNKIVETTSIAAFQPRGGTGVIASNTVTGPGGASADVVLNVYRATGTNIYKTSICCDPWGPIDSTNKWDGHELASGYPGLDQIGRTGPTVYGATNTTQVLFPLYNWGNTFNGTATTCVVGNNPVNSGVYNGYDLSQIPQAATLLVGGRDWTNGPYAAWTPATYPLPAFADPPITLSASVASTVITNTSDLNGVTSVVTPGVVNYIAGESVTFTAPSISGGHSFIKWTLNDGTLYSTNASISLTISNATTFVAVYDTYIQPRSQAVGRTQRAGRTIQK